MKTLILSIALLFTAFFGYAQSANYINAIQHGIDLLDTVKTQQGYVTTTNYLQKVAAANEQDWLAQYYSAYGNLIKGIRGKQDEETKDDIYNTALSYINKANTLSPNNSEIYTLKPYIIFMKMSVYPQQRAMSMVPESNQLIEKAIALDKENPRAYLIMGTSLYYLPELFGGSKEEAKKMLTIAKLNFEKYVPKSLHPNWGKARVEELLKQF